MIKEQNSFQVNLNHTDVFAFLTDDACLPKWVNGIVAIKPIGQHHQGVGDAVLIEVNMPKEGTIKSTVTEWQPPLFFGTEYQAEDMAGKMSFQLTPIDQCTTQVQYKARHYPQTFLLKIFAPLVGWVIKKERKKEHQRLIHVLMTDSAD